MKAWKKGLIIGIILQLFSWFFADSFGLYGLREYGEATGIFGLIFIPLFFAFLGYLIEFKTDKHWLNWGIKGFSIATILFSGYLIIIKSIFFYDPSPNLHDIDIIALFLIFNLILLPFLGIIFGILYNYFKNRNTY